jgi:hypothetical protein
MDDDELIAAMAGGDDTALRELFARHAPWLAARLRTILPAAEVEDVLQESFLAVWRGARGYRPQGSPGGWLWGITRRQAALWLRRRGPDGLPLTVLAARDGQHGGDPAAAVRGRPGGHRGGGAAGRARGHGEKPRSPGPAAHARGAAAAGAGRRRAMTFSDEMAGGRDDLPGPGPGGCPPDVDLQRVWLGVAAEVWRRRPGLAERLAGRVLRSPGLARALVTTPSLLLGWVIASAVVLAAGMAATLATGTPFVALFAPAVAAAGIAYAYGPGIDPAWELSQSMAVSDRMVLLVRVLAVFALNGALGLAASAASGTAAAVTFGWLVPMTAVSALALAAATVTRSATAGAAAGLAAWAITVLSAHLASGQATAAVASTALVLPYLAVAAAGGAIAWFATRIPKGTP